MPTDGRPNPALFALLVAVIGAGALGTCGRQTRPGENTPVSGAATTGGAAFDDSGTLATHSGSSADTVGQNEEDAAYEGVDSRGIPNYAVARTFTPEEADVLRRAYGIEAPHRLYISDSTDERILKYDTQVKRCLTCYVDSYRVGYVSVRRPGETWEEVERRVRTTPPSAFAHGQYAASRSLDDLDPDVQPLAEQMLRDARAAGFRLDVTATYRSPVREAFLMSQGRGRTYTLTSNHSYGRALDIVVDDGNRRHAPTKRDWIAFRSWVTRYRTPKGESFRILGKVDRTWDWAHVDLPSAELGFDNIEQAVARGRACLAPAATMPCNFPPHLPSRLKEATVQ